MSAAQTGHRGSPESLPPGGAAAESVIGSCSVSHALTFHRFIEDTRRPCLFRKRFVLFHLLVTEEEEAEQVGEGGGILGLVSLILFLTHFTPDHPAQPSPLAPALLPHTPQPSPRRSAGSRLQDGLELSRHADLVLFLTDDALDGGGQAAGVPGEDEGVAVLAGAVLLQGAAGVGDGVVVVVGVDHPVVVTWLGRDGGGVRGGVRGGARGDVRGLTSAGQVAGQALVVHEHLSGDGGIGDGVLGRHVGTHHPESATHACARERTCVTGGISPGAFSS